MLRTMKNRFETCTVTLTPLSPIHISGGNSDYGWGAVWIEKSEKMYILDSELLSEILIEKNLFDKYVEKVEEWINYSDSEKEEQSNPCFKFLVDNSHLLFQNSSIIDFVKGLSIAELHAPNGTRFIRNGKGDAYIPGSSIKGAIRTAVIYAILNEYKKRTKKDYLNDEYLRNILNREPDIPNDANSGFAVRKEMDKELLKSVLEDYELTEKDHLNNSIKLNRQKPENGSITNLMRAILVSDSTPIPYVRNNLVDEEVKIIMLENPDINGDRFLNRQALPYAVSENKKECFEQNQHAFVTFNITIDHEILRSFNNNESGFSIIFQGIKDLERIINNFYKNVWAFEQEYYLEQLALPDNNHSKEENMIEKVLDFYDDENDFNPNILPSINIGLGSGMLCKTLFITINEEYRIKIRNLQMTGRQIHNQKRGHNGRGNVVDWINKIATNSRHLVFSNGVASRPLGWAKLSFGPITYENSVL